MTSEGKIYGKRIIVRRKNTYIIFINISFKNIKAETFLHALEEYEIYVSTNTACSSGELSTSVMALYNDRKRASSTLRISLSYVTTTDEINRFLGCFKMVYQRLSVLSRENKE